MQYQNPTPREDVNFTQEHPLKEFAQLLLGIAIVAFLLISLLNLSAGYLAKRLPFSFEQRMASSIDLNLIEVASDNSSQKIRLQKIVERMSAVMDLPDGMVITAHYSDDDMVNALATLGGNIVIFQGLVDELATEQAIAMVIAHEIAHVKLRHPIVALGKGVTLLALASSVGGASGSSTAEWLIGSSANLSLLQFSREQESAADALAAEALQTVYGDLAGAKNLFSTFEKLEAKHFDSSVGLELFRSHPYSKDRWLAIQSLAAVRGWSQTGQLTPFQTDKQLGRSAAED